MRLDRYQSFFFPVIASRGCPEACSFCFSKRMTRGFRTYPLRHVLAQIRARPASVRAMYFVDDNLAGDVDFARELFRELAKLEPRTPFGMQVRTEFCLDPENLRLAHEAGCALITTGFESLNQATLDRTGKGALAARYQEIVAAIQTEGMMASGNFVFGFDWDGPDTFEKTWEFLRDSRIYHSTFTTEIPFPGTATYQRYLREGRILTTDYDEYIGKDKVVVRPLGMTPEQLQGGIRWLTSQYYSVPHRHALYRHAYQNERLFPELRGWARRPALLSLNYFQWFLYTYRMVPSLRWLYDRLVPLNKYRFVGDLRRGTNFWKEPFTPAATATRLDAAQSRSPFYERSGAMKPGAQKLVV
ncbi:MAG: radical SAM protein [Myxococcales bacterium]